jgi:hypothetical protein
MQDDTIMASEGISFEGFFNAIHAFLAKDGYGNPGRTAMNAGSFNFDDIGILPLRAFQFGVAYLVYEQELPESYNAHNARASTLTSGADAYALLKDI